MTEIAVKFKFERATKNTFRFMEVAPEDSQVVGTLYVQKSAFGGKQPAALDVAIKWE